MHTPAWGDVEEEEENDWELQDTSFGGRDGLIFLVDATKPMFGVDESGSSPFRKCLECYKTTMLNKVISSERDLLGIIFFGTAEKENCLNVENLVEFQKLAQPSAEKIIQLEKMLDSEDLGNFEKKYGHSQDFSLSDALWLCQTTFRDSPFKLISRRILLFTNTADPHPGDLTKTHRAQRTAKDLRDLDIDLELLHMGYNFDATLFYKELIQIARGEDAADWQPANSASRWEELMSRVCRRDHKKRSMGKVRWDLGHGVLCGISIYGLVRKTTLPRKVPLDRTTNEILKQTRETFHGETADIILPSSLNKYQEVGGKKIVFRPDEVQAMRRMMEPGLKLLGFKPATRIKVEYHLKPSTFIYPQEELVEGSRTLFAALHERCIARGVVPVCYFTAREGSVPRLVALVPQEQELDELNVQVTPPGFHVVYLPCADNIRSLDITTPAKADADKVAKAKEIVKKLKCKYVPQMIDNPKVQTHWSNMEALALSHDEVRKVEDHTQPDLDTMRRRLGSLSLEFVSMIYPDGYAESTATSKPGSSKRKLESVTGNVSKKPALGASTRDEMTAIAKEHKVEKLKVDELKAFLQAEGVRVTGMKKKDLVDKVYKHLGIGEP